MDSNMMMEILSRCSIDTIDRCKLVCKQWNNLTHESSFLQLHSRRTSTVSGYFLQGVRHCKFIFNFVSMDNNDNSKNISLDFLPDDIQILAASDQGVLCFVTRKYKNCRFHVCKPATQQLQALPNPRLRYRTEKVALVVLGSNHLHYKILRLSEPRQRLRDNYNYHCEVFYSNAWAWKRNDDILLPSGVFLLGSAIFTCGTIYWRTSDNSLLAFDERENYKILPLPTEIHENEYHGFERLTKYEGRLACIHETRTGVYEIWVHKNGLWERRVVMDMEEHPSCCPYPIGFSSVDIALMKGYFDVQFYKFPHKVLKKESLTSSMSDVFAFRSDFEKVELRKNTILKSKFSILGFLVEKLVGFLWSFLGFFLDSTGKTIF